MNENIPGDFILHQNYPNPFNPTTIIKYAIPESGLITLKVYDILGNEISTLVNKEQSAGEYEFEFNTADFDLSSGVYFYQLQAGAFLQTKKLMLLH